MEATAFGGLFVILTLVVCVFNIWLLWNIARRVWNYFTDRTEGKSFWDFPNAIGWPRAIGLLLCAVTLYYLPTTWSSEVRPRNSINAVVKPSPLHDEEKTFVEVEKGVTWEQRMETNRAQNASAREAFDTLPNKQ